MLVLGMTNPRILCLLKPFLSYGHFIDFISQAVGYVIASVEGRY